MANNTRTIPYGISNYRAILYSLESADGKSRLKKSLQETVSMFKEEKLKIDYKKVSAQAALEAAKIALSFVPGGSELTKILSTLE